MRTMKIRTLAAALAIACAPLASQAQTTAAPGDIDTQTQLLSTTAENKGQTQVATKIAGSFANLAGSQDNAMKLVQALRAGSEVKLTTTTAGTGTTPGTTTTTSFTPPTGKMGWGNVFNSLALAQDSLARLGVTNPTNAQLQAALMGGDVTVDGKTTTLKGVLVMRAGGMGWGQIAHATGTKLGPVVSSIRSTQNKVAALPSTTTAGTGTTTPTTAASTPTSKGITTAAGTTAATTAKGNSSKGVVTAGGATAGAVTHGNSGNAGGKGIVTAAGGSAGVTVTHGNSANAPGHGAGVVNAGGGNAAGVTSAAGNAGGNGKGNAGGNGKGKGGG